MMAAVAAVALLAPPASAATVDCTTTVPSRASFSYWGYVRGCGCFGLEAPSRASLDYDKWLSLCGARHCPPAPMPIPVAQFRVVTVADGDTIEVARGEERLRVRLWGVDAPEMDQAFGVAARQRLVDLVQGRMVTLEEIDRDEYDRTVARVWVDGAEAGQRLVGDGLAWWFRAYAGCDATLAAAERGARESRRGLWAEPRPVPPWEWRH